MRSTIMMTIILALVPASIACCQFVLDSLPKPGQWARYQQSITVSSQPDYKPESTVCIRCLANESNPEPKCVWIEIEVTRNREVTQIYKLLILESEFKPGGNPLNDLVKGWVWQSAGSRESSFRDLNWVDGKPRLVTAGHIESLRKIWIVTPPDDAEPLMSDYVEANGQKLMCNGFSFTSRSDLNGQEHLESLAIRLSTETPFGLVSSERSVTTYFNGKEIVAYANKTILVASGEDAVSAIPDVK